METEMGQAAQTAPQQFIKKLLFLAASLALCVGAAWLYLSAQIDVRRSGGAQVMFDVEKGDRAEVIARQLQAQGLISHAYLFLFHVWREGVGVSLKAGTYALNSGMSVREIAGIMVRGDVYRDEVAITIPEGFTVQEIESRFAGVAPVSFARRAGDLKDGYDFLADAPDDASLEGYLFPDTYRFERGKISEEAVLQTMLDNFDRKLTAQLRAEIMRQEKTMFEIVTMASIIEKEVITDEDMKTVSGILWKRLSIGMPLQVDATVAYAVGHKELTYDDLKIDSPYNTYYYKGLPKGPIANPGLRAINAALYSTPSEYLYYLSKSDKQTVFSKTLAEHNRAKALYLK